MTPKTIHSYVLYASVSLDVAAIGFTFTDGTTWQLQGIPPARFAAIVATLKTNQASYFYWDTTSNTGYVTSSTEPAGGMLQS